MKRILSVFSFLIIFISIVFAQEKRYIDIRDFGGVINSGDFEDIPKEYFVKLKNLRPFGGLLRKTFGFGTCGYDAVSNVDNIVTYIESHLTNPDEHRYFVYKVSGDSVYLKYWNTLTSDWEIETLIEMLYHKDAQNPIIQEGGVIRFLPGNVGTLGGNEAKGLWYGYIDSLWVFDQKHQRSAGFYNYPTNLDYIGSSPDLTFNTTIIDSGDFSEAEYYKYTFIFDGTQETLLKDGFSANFNKDQFLKVDISFIPANLSLRINGMDIYRSDDANGIYNKIHAIDFLRDSSDVAIGDTAWNGNYYIYVPDLSNYSFSNTEVYQIELDNVGYNIENPGSGTGYEIFDVLGDTIVGVAQWNVGWGLWEKENGSYGLVDGHHNCENSGAFSGNNVVILNQDFGADNLGGGVLYYYNTVDSIKYRMIDINEQKAVHFRGDTLVYDSLRTWKVLSVGNGLYDVTKGTSYDTITFFDTGLIEGAEYSLAGEVSIKVNGKFARIIGSRLWQANLFLDPGGENEVHNDWGSYSELEQYDVNPVGNVISFANEGVGEITGLAELFGNPVIMKRNNISMINIKNYPVTPSNWSIIESVHNVGNIADNGYITVLGKLYVCYYDGIYEFTPNDLAESSTTPSKRLKITEPIEDTYLSLTLTQKEGIISEYNQKYNEILFVLGSEMWAYNVNEGEWREISSIIPEIMCLDDTANVMMYDDLTTHLWYSGKDGNVSVELKTKTFPISDERDEIVRYAWITYLSETELALNFFGDDTLRNAFSLPVNSVINTYKLSIGQWSKKFYFSIMDSISSNTNTEIHRIKIEYEGEIQ